MGSYSLCINFLTSYIFSLCFFSFSVEKKCEVASRSTQVKLHQVFGALVNLLQVLQGLVTSALKTEHVLPCVD
jgi:hypothetical protein